MLGDIVISVETAARQAEERGHTLIDEIRILMVGLTIHFFASECSKNCKPTDCISSICSMSFYNTKLARVIGLP